MVPETVTDTIGPIEMATMNQIPPQQRIFVYGTLKKGFCRHYALEAETFVGTARTVPRYRMVNVGTYPGLLDTELNGRAILGEIWEVRPETLVALDLIEGTDEGEYIRRRIELDDDSFGPVDAYFYLKATPEMPDCGDTWI
ncbi:gamma-glutamylcyclotransferase family protein [Planctomicrobium sp. SH527]|uniref:gamma-glutamylcyclotransferase family protein n=1 Tax=Planctomicrobium sp. SH527 TaxID=3448123 RepID=UPI003F5B4424